MTTSASHTSTLSGRIEFLADAYGQSAYLLNEGLTYRIASLGDMSADWVAVNDAADGEAREVAPSEWVAAVEALAATLTEV
jgi:hypothetical protein